MESVHKSRDITWWAWDVLDCRRPLVALAAGHLREEVVEEEEVLPQAVAAEEEALRGLL